MTELPLFCNSFSALRSINIVRLALAMSSGVKGVLAQLLEASIDQGPLEEH
jgi:hypothetical protein